MDISVVVPLYNEDESLPELIAWIDRVMKEHRFTYEVILVDDGSKDSTFKVAAKIVLTNSHITQVGLFSFELRKVPSVCITSFATHE